MEETIKMVRGDSSDIYHFSSDDIPTFDSTWSGRWVIAVELGQAPLTSGELSKNAAIAATAKTKAIPANSYFIHQLKPGDTDGLPHGRYRLTVEIRQDVAGEVTFRREVMQAVLHITKEGFVD